MVLAPGDDQSVRASPAGANRGRGASPSRRWTIAQEWAVFETVAARSQWHPSEGPELSGILRWRVGFDTSSKSHQKRQATVPRRSDRIGVVRWGTSSTTRGFSRGPESCSSPGQVSDHFQRIRVQIDHPSCAGTSATAPQSSGRRRPISGNTRATQVPKTVANFHKRPTMRRQEKPGI